MKRSVTQATPNEGIGLENSEFPGPFPADPVEFFVSLLRFISGGG